MYIVISFPDSVFVVLHLILYGIGFIMVHLHSIIMANKLLDFKKDMCSRVCVIVYRKKRIWEGQENRAGKERSLEEAALSSV